MFLFLTGASKHAKPFSHCNDIVLFLKGHCNHFTPLRVLRCTPQLVMLHAVRSSSSRQPTLSCKPASLHYARSLASFRSAGLAVHRLLLLCSPAKLTRLRGCHGFSNSTNADTQIKTHASHLCLQHRSQSPSLCCGLFCSHLVRTRRRLASQQVAIKNCNCSCLRCSGLFYLRGC